MTLQNFPRGGKKPPSKWTSDTLFKQPVKKKRSNEGQKEKKRKNKNQDESDGVHLVAQTAERLSKRVICEGLIILGRVHEATEYHLLVSLPGSTIGVVQATDISEAYTNLLRSVVSDERPDDFKPLPELYSPGDYVVCFVKDIEPESRWQINLSLEPRLVNQNVDLNYIGKGSKVVCTVNSVEDHGYVMDLGVSSVRAFVQSKDAGAKSYFPGKQLFCYVKDVASSEGTATLKLSTVQKYVEEVSTDHLESLDNLVPGTKLNLHVKKVLSNGLQVSFGKDRIGYVNQLYLDKPLDFYMAGMELVGTLMYIVPTVKFGYFTLLTDKTEKSKEGKFKIGDIVESAEVLYTLPFAVVFKLAKNSRGYVALRRTETSQEKLTKQFPPGSTHKCRVISYNWMEGLYMCSMEREILDRKHFTLTDFAAGEPTQVKIKKVNMESGFVTVQAGQVKGYVAPEQVSDEGLSALKRLTVGESVPARVLGLDQERGKIRFTMKKSLIDSELPVLSSIKAAIVGEHHHGTIVKINKYGLLVKFYGDAKGWVNQHLLNKETARVNWNYSVGQTITVRIESVDEITGSMDLSVVGGEASTEDTEKQEPSFDIGQEVTGTITDSSVKGVYVLITGKNGTTTATAYLPAGHMSPCMETAALLASKCVPGDTLSALVFATAPNLILTRTFVSQERYRDFDNLKVGDCIPCSVRDTERDGLRVILPIRGYNTFGFVRYGNVTNFNLLHGNPIMFGKIVSINRKDRRLELSMKLKEIYETEPDPKARMMSAVDALTLYLNKLSELASNTVYASKPISSLSLGQVVKGTVTNVTEDGLIVRLENNAQGIVRKEQCPDNRRMKIGDSVTGTIMWINYAHELVDLTLVPAIMNSISPNQRKARNIEPGTLLRAEIVMVTGWFVLVALKGQGKGALAALPVRHHVNELQPDLSPYSVRKRIRCYALLNKGEVDIVPVCMLRSAFELPRLKETKTKKAKTKETKEKGLKRKKQEEVETEPVPRKKLKTKQKQAVNNVELETEVISEETSNKVSVKSEGKKKEKKRKQKRAEEEVKEEEEEEEENEKKKKKEKKEKEDEEIKKEEEQEGQDKENIQTERTNKTTFRSSKRATIPECGFFWDANPDDSLKKSETSSESEDEAEEQPRHKRKKLSAAERREQERQKEREIRQREEALASNQLPNSVDQFDRLVLASPDSSLIWLQYMAYHLQATEIDKARAVARRAIKTINYREENERLNIWNAWLNLESKFGTAESLNDVYQEAVRNNDALKVYTHMLSVHAEAGRQNELEKIVNTMIGKFKKDPKVWIECGAALLKIGLKDRSRHIMQRALQSLVPSEHVNLMVRFAHLESKFGDKERSQTLFEQILSSYPKRVDVWCSYVDSLVKSEDIDLARKVLERAVVQTLPAAKMKTLFKKFVWFEEAHGTADGVARVQKMAADYVERQCKRENV